MNKKEDKKKEAIKLYLTGKYNQQEIAETINVSRQTISRWVQEAPVTSYLIIRTNLVKELTILSKNPAGHEDAIFKYMKMVETINSMIRKAKYIPHLQV